MEQSWCPRKRPVRDRAVPLLLALATERESFACPPQRARQARTEGWEALRRAHAFAGERRVSRASRRRGQARAPRAAEAFGTAFARRARMPARFAQDRPRQSHEAGD